MPEEKKRFPWWVWAVAALLGIFVVVAGFIETVGRRGTLIVQYDRIQEGMSWDETVRILGRDWYAPLVSISGSPGKWRCWDDGTVILTITLENDWVRSKSLSDSGYMYPGQGHTSSWWRMSRSIAKAYTAIHGPRR
jgi:hypothetical protein